MVLRSKIKAGLAVWLVAEAGALATAVHFWGWPATILAGFLSTVFGFYVLRNAGRDSIEALRRAVGEASGRGIEIPTGGALRILAGVLLVAPGFVSDFVGLILLLPFVRERIARRFTTVSRSTQNGIVDLDPDEWRTGQADSATPSCEPPPGMLPGEPKSRTDQEMGR